MNLLAELGSAFLLGLLTPLGAVRVLPLHAGFLVYLAGRLPATEVRRRTRLHGRPRGIVTSVIGGVSPIAFGLPFVIPCSPLFIAALFARTVSAADFAENILRFLFFGIGLPPLAGR